MKIAFFHELPKGGVTRFIIEVTKLLKKNHTLDLFVIDELRNDEVSQHFDNVYFFNFVSKTWEGHNWKVRLYKDTIELIKLYFVHKKIAKKVKKNNYDFLFINASQFINSPFLLRFESTIKIFYCHDPYYRLIYDPLCRIQDNISFAKKIYEKINRSIRKVLDKQNLNKAIFLIANSNFTKMKIKKTHERKSVVVYPGVNPYFFSPSKVKKNIDILFIGSLSQIDGYDLFQEIQKHFKTNFKVKTLLKEEGWMSDKELLDIYRRSKVVLCFGFNEAFGSIPLEAMACGVPVVAINKGGYKETVVNNKTGFLVTRNPKFIALKIEFLLKNPAIIKIMSKNARKHILDNFTWERTVEGIESFLNKI